MKSHPRLVVLGDQSAALSSLLCSGLCLVRMLGVLRCWRECVEVRLARGKFTRVGCGLVRPSMFVASSC